MEQLAKILYLRYMEGMKEVLNLGEFKIGDRNSSDYKYFKRVVMDQFYAPMVDFFEDLVRAGVLSRCPCGTNVRRGYKEDCKLCNGAGYVHSESFQEWLKKPVDEEQQA